MDPMRNDADLRARLSPLAYHVTQEGGTERAFTGEHWGRHEPGEYRCACCDSPLFDSDQKYDSGTGWPSFWAPAKGARVEERPDASHGMRRVEARCGSCGAHLGHVFDDGPRPTGRRYCNNGLALRFVPAGQRLPALRT